MPKYIDADALKVVMVFSQKLGHLTVPEMRDILTEIDSIPAADVEPVVVHCRDCKYRDQRIPVHNAICTKCYEMDCMQGYGFCSMGESDD